MMILDACGFHPIIGVNVLIQKALITVSKDGRFDMHDLIQEMGQHIVRGENPKTPELHSRVWQMEDVRKICSVDAMKENDRIQALKVDFLLEKDIPPNLLQVVGNMKKLRWIYLEDYRETSLPSEFQPTNLCYLGLTQSYVKQLWEGNKVLPNLKVIDLSCSTHLVKTPDFNGLPCLERLILSWCNHLKVIHPSIGYHERLIFLDMEECTSLEIFPPIIRMKKLETLQLCQCSKLSMFPEIQTSMDNLKDLQLRGSGIEVVPSSIGEYCTNLHSLDLSRCKHLQSIEGNFHRLKNLNVLRLNGCDQLNNIPADGLFDIECKKCNVDHILQSMLQGNAIEDYYISMRLDGPYIPRRGLANAVFTLQLPWNWNTEFSGFLGRWNQVIKIEEVKGMENKGDILEDEDENEDEEGIN
ncbi:hypothetical protein OSB04_018209 [Centaurea solstitialis]|uniref:Disease resistance protein Roq1-like winged-helix domain-containing protein n=1 Tax=Centaurea solstitialis TaxID=347529 RepID=A0AA38WLH3_9ASTR|nr:hypothetical protein OSB04_018209 [Centaurea solstitialis]